MGKLRARLFGPLLLLLALAGQAGASTQLVSVPVITALDPGGFCPGTLVQVSMTVQNLTSNAEEGRIHIALSSIAFGSCWSTLPNSINPNVWHFAANGSGLGSPGTPLLGSNDNNYPNGGYRAFASIGPVTATLVFTLELPASLPNSSYRFHIATNDYYLGVGDGNDDSRYCQVISTCAGSPTHTPSPTSTETGSPSSTLSPAVTSTPTFTPTPSPTATCFGAGGFWDPVETVTVDASSHCGLNFNPPTAGDYTTSSLLPAGDYRVNLVPNFCSVYNGAGTLMGAGLRFGTLIGASFSFAGAFGQQPIVPVNSCADVWFGGPNPSPGSVFHATLASPGRLYFLVGDTNCFDNSGSVRVMIEALVSTVPCGSATISPSPSPSRTPSAPSPSHSPTPSRTRTPSPSVSPTGTLVGTLTNSPSPSSTATLASTLTSSPTASTTPTLTASPAVAPPAATAEGDFFLSPLAANPNPAYGNGGLYFAWRLGAGASIQVYIYTVSGQLVRRLAPSAFPAGASELFWDGRNDHGMPVASGSYFARIRAEKAGHEPKEIWEKAAILR